MRRIVAFGSLALLLAGCGLLSPSQRMDAFLRAVAGAEDDRGWQYLDETTREVAYQDDVDAFLRDASSADWAGLRWSEPRVLWTDDGFAHVVVDLQSDPSAVPRFLLDRHLLHGICDGARGPIGLGAFVDTRAFQVGGMGGGGTTGSGKACNAEFGEPAR